MHDRYAGTLVLDFDGTICLGDGPVWAYAERALARLAPDHAGRIRTALGDYLDGRSAADHPDGYAAVAALTMSEVGEQQLAAAYLESRTALADPATEISAPPGLHDLLDELGGTVRRVVVTNSPATGIDVALDRIGLSGGVDEVVTSAGKPDRLPEILDRLLHGRSPESLMSVGDFWRNDIAPALDLGAMTAFVDRLGRDPGPAHVRARTLGELYPELRAWAASPAAFAASHKPHTTLHPDHHPEGAAVPSDS